MGTDQDPRWRQRLARFRRATSRLVAACAQGEYTDLERAGLVQTFAFSFELGWKTLKDLLDHEGFPEQTPRGVLRRAFETGHLAAADVEAALDALDQRNLLSHTYDDEAAQMAVDLIRSRFAPLLERLLAHLEQRATP